MNYIRITEENIDKEHICCTMSGKQSLVKKEWLKRRFPEGLVFYRGEERGKCFIEYIPAENAWVPIEAAGYLYINCLWVSGSMKGHGYSSDLLDECIRDAKAQGKKGLCILCAEGRKREFLADPQFLAHKGFLPAGAICFGPAPFPIGPVREKGAVHVLCQTALPSNIERVFFHSPALSSSRHSISAERSKSICRMSSMGILTPLRMITSRWYSSIFPILPVSVRYAPPSFRWSGLK